MEPLIVNVNWIAVVVGAVVAYALGALWYSDKMFGKQWREGSGTPVVANRPIAPSMLAQAVATFLLAWVIGVTETTNSLALAILVALTASILIKANGLFAGKTTFAIFVESSYVLVMAAVMIAAHAVL